MSEPPRPGARCPDLSGRTLGDFKLLRRIGQGGMGQVYLARQLTLNRQVALKLLRPELAEDEGALERFRREARAVARITHANIVQVYAIGEADGISYMALEYVEGRTLREYLARKGPPELATALSIMRQVAAALQRAAEMGFVHRDIKPENILITRKGEVKVADFGLSRCFSGEAPLNLTQSGTALGTPLYMSPEQVKGGELDPRSDLYSLGVTCYHMLAGQPPFHGQTPYEVALHHVQSEPRPLADLRPDLPPELCAIVQKMMQKRPEDRYQTPREVLRDLARVREGLPLASPPSAAGPPTVSLPAAGAAAQTRETPGAPPPLHHPAPPPAAQAGAVAEPSAVPRGEVGGGGGGHRSWLAGAATLALAVVAGAALHGWRHPPAAEGAVAGVAPPPGDSGAARGGEPARPKVWGAKLRGKLGDDRAAALRLQRGLVLIEEGRLGEAEQIFRNLPDDARGFPYRSFAYAVLEAHRDHPEESLDHFRAVLDGRNRPLPGLLQNHYPLAYVVARALRRDEQNLNARGEELPAPLRRFLSPSGAAK